MKEWKRAAACVCIAVLLCYSIIMGLLNNSLVGFIVPFLCVGACVLLCVLLRKLPGLDTKKKLQFILETVIVAAAAGGMILFI